MRLFFIFLGIFFFPLSTMSADEPSHSVIVKDGDFEIRQYAPSIVAEVEVSGDLQSASGEGFQSLAGFIFGNNSSKDKIKMTAPVTRQISQPIEMTAPVTRTETAKDTWTVTFYMPEEWTMDTLPKPNDANIVIRQEPGLLMATIKFSGRASEQDYLNREQQLKLWISDQGYQTSGPARFAGYNAPMVPGPFRRNEVMIPVVQTSE